MESKHGDGHKAAKDKPVDHLPATANPQRIDRVIARFISDHPAACLAGALALGFFVARLSRDRG
jgi:hypothetical protein